MNKRYSITDLISLYYENEFLAVEATALPDLSRKHKRKMQKIFDMFAKTKRQMQKEVVTKKTGRSLPLKKRLLIAAIIILALALFTGFIMAFSSKSFRGLIYHDNTHLFSFDISDSPTVIEEEYALSIVPEGYELQELLKSDVDIFVKYKNDKDEEFIFIQTTKNAFNPHINTEGFTLEECVINDCDGVCVEYESESSISSFVVWNNSDYILRLHGNFTKEELMNLATINEINGF